MRPVTFHPRNHTLDNRPLRFHPRGVLALETVVARHGTVLVLDAACTRVQVGLVVTGREPAWIATEDEAGVGLFKAAAALLGVTDLKPQSVGAYVFCDGPGSQLGIRTAAMAIRTWQALREDPAPIFTYRSLRLAALGLAAGGATTPFAVACDARRESWFVSQAASGGSVGAVERLPADDVAKLGIPIHQPDGFRSWAEPPVPMIACDYTVGALFAQLGKVGLLEPSADAEPWNPAPPDYRKWSGERHRARSASADPR